MARINLKKFIAEHYKGGISARDVIREAVTNSIHAGSTQISVNLKFSDKQSEMFSYADERVVLEEISITDNGEGFTDANLNYFDEICTSHKDKIGGKGLGRLSFLKFANLVEIRSQLSDMLVEFKYTLEFTPSNVKKTKVSGNQETKITLSKFETPANTQVRKLVTTLCDDLRLIIFMKQQLGKSVHLKFTHNSGQKFDGIFELNGSNILTLSEDSFEIKTETFKCYLFRDDPPAKGISAMMCADELCIEEHQISNRFDSCRYLISVTSDYFNLRSNMVRQRLEIPKTEDDVDLASPISRKELIDRLYEKCFEMVDQIGQGDVDTFKQKNIDELKKYYPFIDISSLSGEASVLDADAIVRTYRAQQARREDKLVESLQKGKKPSWDDLSHLARDDLARFVVHRALVIESLHKMPRDEAEDTLHKAILPKKIDGQEIQSNSLWLVDDKFLSYSSVFSDKTLSKIVKEVNSSVSESLKWRPDVAVFFSNDPDDRPNKLVVIEFKKPSATIFENNKALTQCRLYATELAKEIKSVREVFAFSIVEIDDDFYNDMKQTGFKDVFSLSERVVYNDFLVSDEDKIPLHMYVMPPSALVKDAKARNKVFEEVLRFNVEEALNTRR